jgi:hypothetical protein
MKFVSKFKLELALAWQALVAPGHGILTDAARQHRSRVYKTNGTNGTVGYCGKLFHLVLFKSQKMKPIEMVEQFPFLWFPALIHRFVYAAVYQPAFFTVNHSFLQCYVF